MQFSAAVTWDVMHNVIWRHCSKRLSEASSAWSVSWAVSTTKDVVWLKLLSFNLAWFGIKLNLIVPELLVCHTRFGNTLYKEGCCFCFPSSLCAKITFSDTVFYRGFWLGSERLGRWGCSPLQKVLAWWPYCDQDTSPWSLSPLAWEALCRWTHSRAVSHVYPVQSHEWGLSLAPWDAGLQGGDRDSPP